MGLEDHHSICWRSERSFCTGRTISVLFIRAICGVSKVGDDANWFNHQIDFSECGITKTNWKCEMVGKWKWLGMKGKVKERK